MNILKRYCNALDFDSYEDFYKNFQITSPENFHFAYDVVDEYARLEPHKRAMVWCDDLGNEEFFDFERIKRLSDKSANYFCRSASARATRCSSFYSVGTNIGRR